jgi:toxin ParE1/3/4
VAPAERLRFIEEARADFREALRWYTQRDPELGAAFSRAVKRATATISDAPDRWPVKDGTHRYLLGHFPYTIAYYIEGRVVSVIAVAHQSRDLASWSSRR